MSHDAITFFLTRYGLTTNDLNALLDAALEAGGDYADLYFEYSRTNSLNLEERLIKTANRAVTQGVGVRVIVGEKTGYAYTDDITPASIRQAAQTAACIARDANRTVAPVAVAARAAAHDLYPLDAPVSETPIERKIELLRDIDERCYAADRRIQKVQVSLADEWKVVMVAASDGTLAGDIQPLARLSVTCIADQDGELRAGRAGGGGRRGFDMFAEGDLAPEALAREAVRLAVLQFDAVEAPAQWKWCWGRAGLVFCCTKPLGMALKPILTARRLRPFPTSLAGGWRAKPVRLWMTARCPAVVGRSIWTTKATRLRVPC